MSVLRRPGCGEGAGLTVQCPLTLAFTCGQACRWPPATSVPCTPTPAPQRFTGPTAGSGGPVQNEHAEPLV